MTPFLFASDPAGRRGAREVTRGLIAVLDTLSAGIVLWDPCGGPVHLNAAMSGIRARSTAGGGAWPEVERFAAGCARALGPRPPTETRAVTLLAEADIQMGGERVQLRAHLLRLSMFGRDSLVLVTLEQSAGSAVADAARWVRAGLTTQQMRVAKLLAEGLSNEQLAAALSVSPHTARNHTQQVLRKLGIRSRAQVGARLHQIAG